MAVLTGSKFWDATKATIQFAQTSLLQPMSTIGISGYFLDAVKTQGISRRMNITDYYAEDGFPLQEVVSREPRKVVITGIVAERAMSDAQIRKYISMIPKATAVVQTFLPQYTAGVKDLMEGKNSKLVQSFGGGAASVVNATTNLFSQVVASIPKPTKQGIAYNYFDALISSAITLSIQIDKLIYIKNMVLEGYRFTQPEGYNDHSEVELMFKELRFVGTQVGSFAQGNTASGSTGSQAQGQTKTYVQGTPPPNTSVAQNAVANPK